LPTKLLALPVKSKEIVPRGKFRTKICLEVKSSSTAALIWQKGVIGVVGK